MKISDETSQKIKNMGLVCSILVVCIHSGFPNDNPLSAGWFCHQFVSQGVARIAVPFFFLVSGFFFAAHFDDRSWYRRENAKRLKTLLVPYVFWCLAAAAAAIPLGILSDILAGRPFGTNVYFLEGTSWIRVIGFDLTDYPIHVPLWYVRCLLLFSATAFIFKKGVESLKLFWLCAAFAFNLAIDFVPNETFRLLFTLGYSTSGVFYFSVGAYLQRFPPKPTKKIFTALAGTVGVALLLLKVFAASHAWPWETGIGKLSLPFLLLFFWNILPASRWPQWLTACAFPIYLVHILTHPYFDIALKSLSLGKTAMAFIRLFGSVFVSIALAMALRRVAPRFAGVIFGGR